MTAPTLPFPERAAAEIDALHRLLQAWFRAEGSDDPAPVLAHFDERFSMTTPAGGILPFETFARAFPGLRGSRPGLVMTITDVMVQFADARSALVTYRERQTFGEVDNLRRSTALLLDRPDRPTPVWMSLHETMEA
ncbi:DUF4440 domain-containing protein [Methylobacterium nonmethylotrophicum]|uniref:DUF4440 domain-containing protein n=1 Tax=Methylobacterium nonmethylotrophicum TaxID=1141884 RepID=A0A4Z0NFX8_9HYPH|nr:DUF4440 domain-containing protein [Methylobacterium nonmethylotrophicum]TGD94273.1 DUF4440 domain-containing protein [Methylobacterium nonmethylotrophicum]